MDPRTQDSADTNGREAWLAKAIVATMLIAMLAGDHPSARAGDDKLPHAFDAGWRGEAVCTLLVDNPWHRIGRCEFPPGVGHEWHYHRPHSGYALSSGTMRIEDADGVQTRTIEAGISWTSEGCTRHQVLNVGDTTASYLIIEPAGGRDCE